MVQFAVICSGIWSGDQLRVQQPCDNYTETHQRNRGIDLRARTRRVCILDSDGITLFHRGLQSAPEPSLKAIAPIARASCSEPSALSVGIGSPRNTKGDG